MEEEIELEEENIIQNVQIKERDPTIPEHIKTISEEDIENWNNKSTFSGSYNDLTDQPDLTTYENDIENINVNGTVQAIENKVVNIIVPTKTSDITNDSNFVTDDSIETITNIEIEEILRF